MLTGDRESNGERGEKGTQGLSTHHCVCTILSSWLEGDTGEKGNKGAAGMDGIKGTKGDDG